MGARLPQATLLGEGHSSRCLSVRRGRAAAAAWKPRGVTGGGTPVHPDSDLVQPRSESVTQYKGPAAVRDPCLGSRASPLPRAARTC